MGRSRDRRQVLAFGAAVLALLLLAVLAPALSSDQPQAEDLPWPYCAPDAEGPVPAATLAKGSGERPRVLPPTASALVPVVSVGTLSQPMTEDGFEDVQIARVDTLAAVMQLERSTKHLGVLDGGVASMSALVETWPRIEAKLAEGHGILAGVQARWDDGTLDTGFFLDTTDGTWIPIQRSPGSDNDERVLRELIELSPPAIASFSSFEELFVAWNLEQDAPRRDRPIHDAWSDYITETYSPWEELPRAGTQAWWDAAPPECRSLSDAPASVLEGLSYVRVQLEVPETFDELETAAICLRIELGSMGCTGFRPDPDATMIELEGYGDGGPIFVELAKEKPDGLSWIERTVLAEIPADVAAAGTVVVSLDSALAASTYEEMAARVASTRTSFRSYTYRPQT